LVGTQHAVLQAIHTWTEDPDGKIIFWLHGMAGTGKSTIARTVANSLNDGTPFSPNGGVGSGTALGASFFFKQNDASRSQAGLFFSTIAKTLAKRIPNLKPHVLAAIESDDDVGTKAFQQQMALLIVRPLLALGSELILPLRFVIIIDGLDECENQQEVEHILGLLRRLQPMRHIQIRFLITSHPEEYIRNALSKETSCRLYLDKVKTSGSAEISNDDIALFLRHRLENMAANKWIDPSSEWRDGDVLEGRMQQLVKKADGLFIYAATICRFLDEELDPESLELRLGMILQDATEGPTPQQGVDEMYLNILRFHVAKLSFPHEKASLCSRLQAIVGNIAILFEPVSVTTLGRFLEKHPDKFRRDRDLAKLRSVLSDALDESSVLSFVHLSFRDFLLDKTRSQEFWVDKSAVHLSLFCCSLQIMEQELRQDICDLHLPGSLAAEVPRQLIEKNISQHLRYSCRYWAYHLADLIGIEFNGSKQRYPNAQGLDTPESILADGGPIHVFLKKNLLYWLEALSLIGEGGASTHIINQLLSMLKVNNTKRCNPAVRMFTNTESFVSRAEKHRNCLAWCETCGVSSSVTVGLLSKLRYRSIAPHSSLVPPRALSGACSRIISLRGSPRRQQWRMNGATISSC